MDDGRFQQSGERSVIALGCYLIIFLRPLVGGNQWSANTFQRVSPGYGRREKAIEGLKVRK